VNIRLGDSVVDSISGFKGIATARTEYLYKSSQILVECQALDDTGKPVDGVLFDEARLRPMDGGGLWRVSTADEPAVTVNRKEADNGLRESS